MPGTPASDDRLETRRIGDGFVDPSRERFTAAQQLLRTGPRNVRIIQSSPRQIAPALGIPAERLPVPGNLTQRVQLSRLTALPASRRAG
jgi:hypothetical protein